MKLETNRLLLVGKKQHKTDCVRGGQDYLITRIVVNLAENDVILIELFILDTVHLGRFCGGGVGGGGGGS